MPCGSSVETQPLRAVWKEDPAFFTVILDISVPGEAVMGLLAVAPRVIPRESYLRAELDKGKGLGRVSSFTSHGKAESKSGHPLPSGARSHRPAARWLWPQ